MSSSSTARQADDSIFASTVMIGILLIAANLRAPITSLGPVLSQVQTSFNLTAGAGGLLNALPLLIFATASPLAPWVTRHFGLERSLLVALLLIMLGCMVRSIGLLSGLWVGTFMLGIGIAIANVLVVPLVKRNYPQKTGLCVGLYAATMALMAALGSGISAPLSTASNLSWKLSLGIWCIVALIAVLCWWPHAKHAAPPTPNLNASSHGNAWKSGIAWQISMFMALQTMVFYTLIDWYPAMAFSFGIDANEAGMHLFIYQAVAVIANLATSVAIKRTKDQRLLGLACSLNIAIGLLGLLVKPSLSLIWLLFAGVGAGMSMVTCLTLFGLRARDHHQANALSAMGQCIGYGLGAIGPFVAGLLHSAYQTWSVTLVILLSAALLQTVFAMLAGRNRYA